MITEAERERLRTKYMASKEKLHKFYKEALVDLNFGISPEEFLAIAKKVDPVNYDEFEEIKTKLTEMSLESSYPSLSQACERYLALGCKLVRKVAYERIWARKKVSKHYALDKIQL